MYPGEEDWSEEVHLCMYCAAGFSSTAALLTHQCRKKRLEEEQTDPRYTWSCDLCTRRFASNDGLYKHKRSVHEGVVHCCPTCGKDFTQASSLNKHIATVHRQEKLFPCTQCGKQFSQKGNLNQHVAAVHEDSKPYKCSTCGKGFTSAAYLNKHISTVHLKEKQFPCPHCGKRFGRKTHLEEHVAGVHEGVRYACDQCDYSASTKSDLLRHLKMIHLKEYPFPCDNCDSGYVRRRELDAHMKSKHPVEYQKSIDDYITLHPEECNECGKRFKTEIELRRHRENIHKLE